MSPEAMMHKFSEGSDAWAFGTAHHPHSTEWGYADARDR